MKPTEILYKYINGFLALCWLKTFYEKSVHVLAIASLTAFCLMGLPHAAHAQLEAKAGSFIVNSGTGTQTITGVGFRPKAYILFYTKNSTPDTDSNGRGSILSIGMTDDVRQFCMASGSEDSQGTSDVGRRGFSDRVLATHEAHQNQLVEGEARHVSMDADGFTIDIITEFIEPANPIVSYIALGGDDLLVDVDTVDLAYTKDTSVDVNYPGFEPDVVITSYIGQFLNVDGDPINDDHSFSLGWALNPARQANNNQYSMMVASRDNEGTAMTYARFDDTRAGTAHYDGADDAGYEIGNFDSDGFSVTTRLKDAPNEYFMGYLALKLGTEPNVYSTARTARTTTGDDVESNAGFEPIFLLGIGSAAVTSPNTNTAGCSMTIGFSDGTDTFAIMQHDQNAADLTNTHNRVTNSQFMSAYSAGGSIDWRSTLSYFDPSGWTINYEDAASAAYLNAFLAFGPGGPTELSVNPGTMDLSVGDIQGAIIYGGTSPYTVSSSDPSVATVTLSNDTLSVTAVGAGGATITVMDDFGASTYIDVVVTQPLAASPENVSFYPGQTATVAISGGAPGYSAASGNPSVASVSVSGDTLTLFAVGGGTITVTITDTADNHAYVSVTVGDTITPGLGDCPIPPFATAGVGPNVLLVLDHSGSMGRGATLVDSNWELSRWETAKTVFKNIINDNPNIRFGLMRLDGSNFIETLEGEHFRQGGKLLRPCGTPGTELIDYIDNWGDLLQPGDPGYRDGYSYRNSNDPQTWTVLAETLASAGRYFATIIDGNGNRVGKGPAGFGYYKEGVDYTYNYDQDGDSITEPYAASLTDDLGNAINSTSPITQSCQKTFIIFLTDGESNYDSDWNVVTDVIGDYDGDNDPEDCKKGDTDCSTSGRVEYFDDVAKYLYENDMRSDLPEQQNIITYVIGFGFDAGNVPAFLEDAADNGGGQFFLAQNNISELTNAMQSAIQDIMAKISSGTAVTTITTSSSTDDYLFRAKFLPGASWRGYLERFTLPYDDTDTADWEAGGLLNNRVVSNTHADRKIYTPLLSEFINKIEFTDDFIVSNPMSLKWGVELAEANDIINYIRGDTTHDGGKYRDRNNWLLGDIVYSTPVTVGAPKGWYFDHPYKSEPPEFASYPAFKSAHSNRKTMIYVGANDGMLHAFDSDTGQEEWAFIPYNLHAKLKALTVEDCHKYYVDLTVNVKDVWDGSKWLTMLIGGNRFGGEEYFALDVTNPSHSDFEVLWDAIPFPGMLSSNVPAVGKVKAHGGSIDHWVAIITSGYHDSDQKGRIGAFDISDGSPLGIWVDNKLEDETQAKSIGSPYYSMTPPTAFDSDLDGYLDLIYAGDTEGSLWKFFYDYQADTWKKFMLFSTGGQPITAAPAVAFDADGNLRIYFGTGAYLEESDKDNNTRNAFYCLVDKKQADGHYTGTYSLTGKLQDLTAIITKYQFENDLDVSSQTTATDMGWYIQLDIPAAHPAERVLGKALVVSGVVFFTSFVPNQDVCGYGGDSRLYAIDYVYGVIDDLVLDEMAATDRHIDIGTGIPSEPVFYFDPKKKKASVLVQKSNSEIINRDPNLNERPMLINSWRAR
ncbi:MAG: PilC/PilY family type IV pilus protein [Desulfobacterales bacterium]|jgi:type IV pilus assembly protein PilY1